MVESEGPQRSANGHPASIRDIARQAGVSVTTVSHALSGKRPVAPETARRVRALVPELGYVPYSAARSLQSGKSLVIGLVVPDIGNQFFGELAAGVEAYADNEDYGVILCTSQADERREKRYFNLLRNRSVDGLIYNAGDADWEQDLPSIASDFPLVIVDEYVPGVDSRPVVAADHFQGGRLAGEHLRSLGHTDVVMISGPRGLRSTDDRIRGFQLSFPAAVILGGDYSERSGRTLAGVVADHHASATAIFASNDIMAFGAMAEFAARGVRVPFDISIVGFDDVDFASRITPPLTSVRQPAFEIGRNAAQLLLDHLIHGAPLDGADLSLPVRLIPRGSSAAPRPASAD